MNQTGIACAKTGIMLVQNNLPQNSPDLSPDTAKKADSQIELERPPLSQGDAEGLNSQSQLVLVIEDDFSLRSVISSMFRKGGYSVLSASSGEEGIVMWESKKSEIDLVFIDVMLGPGMDGIEVAKRLRALKTDVKILFTTGYTPITVRSDFTSIVGQWFLEKPFTMFDLLRMARLRMTD